jgi:hypothetical protein
MQHRRTFSSPAITYAHRSVLIDSGLSPRFAMKTFLKQLLAALVVLSMVGCTTIQPLSVNASELSRTLKKGDKVEVVTSKGQQLNFKVDSVDDTGLQGAGQRVAYNDIQSISRKEIDTKNTTFVVLGVLAAGALAAAAGGGGGGGGGSGY